MPNQADYISLLCSTCKVLHDRLSLDRFSCDAVQHVWKKLGALISACGNNYIKLYLRTRSTSLEMRLDSGCMCVSI